MSIELHQLMCDHDFDNNFFCKKCHYTDLMKIQMKKIEKDRVRKIYGWERTVDFISDIHADFWIKELNPQSPKFKKQLEHFITEVLVPKGSEILILAGDQGHYYQQDIEVLKALKEYYKHICIVPGNHDLYLLSKSSQDKYFKNSRNRVREMKAFCQTIEGLHYLDGEVVNCDGIDIGGVGMWFDYSFARDRLELSDSTIRAAWEKDMNDSRYIFGGSDNYIVPTAYGGSFKVSSFNDRDYLMMNLRKLKQIKSCDIMVSHYSPKVREDFPEKWNNVFATFYHFDGKSEIDRIKPKFWVHGHIHAQVDEMYNDTRILCNPLGYPKENSYTEIKTIQL